MTALPNPCPPSPDPSNCLLPTAYCLLIDNCAVLTCDPADRFFAAGRIVVEGGRIAAVEEAGGDLSERPGPVERVDASGCLAIPGLVNAHAHLYLSLFRGLEDDLGLFPWIRAIAGPTAPLAEADLLAATRLGAVESLKSGTTCLCECCRYRPDLAAQVARELGLRIVAGGQPASDLFGKPLPHDYPKLVEITRQTAETQRGPDGLVSVSLGAHSPYLCSPDFLREAKRWANAGGYDFTIHLAEGRDEVDYCRERFGKTPVQHLADLGLLDARTIGVHCVWLTDEDIQLYRRSGARIAHCPVSNAKLGSGVAAVPKYRAAGIPVGLGTDSVMSNNTLSLFQEMRFAVLIQRALHRDPAVLTAADALRLATVEAARVLGLDREIGSLEVGKRADFVLLRSTHPYPLTKELALSDVVYATHRDAIEAVYVGGERVVDRGRLTNVDEEALLARLQERYRSRQPFAVGD